MTIPLPWRYGGHRVLGDAGTAGQGGLPQAAQRLAPPKEHDPAEWQAGEILLDVERLNVDSASFRQIEEEARAAGEGEGSAALEDAVARRVLAIVAARGKLHNPVTGSGGMLLGRVRRVGAALGEPGTCLGAGERVATLVSLTLTPLRIDEVRAVHLGTHQIEVRGAAVLFASGSWARLDDPLAADLPEGVTLAALDVAGAAPQVARLLRDRPSLPGTARVLVLGCGGKSGLLVSAAARRAGAVVVGVETHPGALAEARELGACHALLQADAADALALAQAAIAAGGDEEGRGGEFDLVVSCVNSPGAEMAAILSARDGGMVYFFSMATSFTRAALGAEGAGKDIQMLIGNGYCHGHAEATLRLLHDDDALRRIFVRRYG